MSISLDKKYTLVFYKTMALILEDVFLLLIISLELEKVSNPWHWTIAKIGLDIRFSHKRKSYTFGDQASLAL